MSTIRSNDLLKVLSLPEGRAVLWDFLGITGIFKQPFAGDDSTTNFQAGTMNPGLVLWADCLEVSPELTGLMIKEQGNVAGHKSADADLRAAKPAGDVVGGTADSAASAERAADEQQRRWERDPNGLGFGRSGEDLAD